MSTYTHPTYIKRVIFDDETGDWGMYLDGEIVGYAPTKEDGQCRLDTQTFALLNHLPPLHPTPTPTT
ncbi:MAG: hypothetical protein HC828_08570 [Blastochloris sp.]|nr:hypothetical protein [Blastochloris sp.]